MAVILRRLPATKSSLDTAPIILTRSLRNLRCQQASGACRVVAFSLRNLSSTSQQTETVSDNVKDSDAKTGSERVTESSEEGYVCCLRNLPNSITPHKIVELFGDDVKIVGGEKGVHFILKKEKSPPCLMAYVELASKSDLDKVLKLERPFIRKRFIDVSKVSKSEMIQDQRQWELTASLNWVRLDGLPFRYTPDDVQNFFKGFGIDIGPEDLAPVIRTGICYVKLPSTEAVDSAIEKNNPQRYIGNRYVEMRRASATEAEVVRAGSESMRPGTRSQQRFQDWKNTSSRREVVDSQQAEDESSEHTVYMRGLPFWTDKARIYDFFSPLVPSTVELVENRQGRFSGEAYVSFPSSSDVEEALKKHRHFIGMRYVEIFHKSEGW